MSKNGSSRIPGFYKLGVPARREKLAASRGLQTDRLASLDAGGIDLEIADGMIENVIGTYGFPFGVALNFQVDDHDYVVPMVIEEPSVVAAASNAAKMIRAGGGFRTEISRPVMIGQVQITGVPDPAAAVAAIEAATDSVLERAREHAQGLIEHGGGPIGLEARVLSMPDDPDGGMVVVHLLVDCRDAMGANAVNSVAEGVADMLADLAGGRVGLRILSNLSDHRTVKVTACVPDEALVASRVSIPGGEPASGAAVRRAIVSASRFAELDPYRAATHNKGIMNGVDAVLLATANDWRAVEAGAHAFASRNGRYEPLAVWRDRDGVLTGTLELPMAVGIVGGALHVHGAAKLAIDILGIRTANALAAVAACAGLASNLAALRALATDGIQRGHMSLHARMVARAAGATGDLVESVAREMSESGDVRTERAREILARQRVSGAPATERRN